MTDGIDGNSNVTNCRLCTHYGIHKLFGKEFCDVHYGQPNNGYIGGFCKHHTKMSKLNKRKWVDCPICGEPDMKKEEGVVHCTNEACSSHGVDKCEHYECECSYETDTEMMLMSDPPKYKQVCKHCGHVNYILVSDHVVKKTICNGCLFYSGGAFTGGPMCLKDISRKIEDGKTLGVCPDRKVGKTITPAREPAKAVETDLKRTYHDMDGNEIPLIQLIKLEPEWAHARIRYIEKIERQFKAAELKLKRIKELLT